MQIEEKNKNKKIEKIEKIGGEYIYTHVVGQLLSYQNKFSHIFL
jgi:hypothetical protein